MKHRVSFLNGSLCQRHSHICRKLKKLRALGVWAGAGVEYSSRYKIVRRAPEAAALVLPIPGPHGVLAVTVPDLGTLSRAWKDGNRPYLA